MSALVTTATAVAAPGGSVALVCGDDVDDVAAALVRRGWQVVAAGTAEVDPDTVEVAGSEVRLVVVLQPDPDTRRADARRLSGGEAAYAVGSRSTALADTRGGALPALARLARRAPAWELRYADAELAAREVVRLWPTP